MAEQDGLESIIILKAIGLFSSIIEQMKKYFPALCLVDHHGGSAPHVWGRLMPVTNMPQMRRDPYNQQRRKSLQSTPASDPSIYGGIKIKGNSEFIAQTRAALTLLEQKAPDAFIKIQTYVGIIEQGEHSGMWAWENPPRYEVGRCHRVFQRHLVCIHHCA